MIITTPAALLQIRQQSPMCVRIQMANKNYLNDRLSSSRSHKRLGRHMDTHLPPNVRVRIQRQLK